MTTELFCPWGGKKDGENCGCIIRAPCVPQRKLLLLRLLHTALQQQQQAAAPPCLQAELESPSCPVFTELVASMQAKFGAQGHFGSIIVNEEDTIQSQHFMCANGEELVTTNKPVRACGGRVSRCSCSLGCEQLNMGDILRKRKQGTRAQTLAAMSTRATFPISQRPH